METTAEYIGFIRYKGKPLEKGYLDARKSAEALLGFDEALRYFIGKQDSELSKIDYEIPVRIKKGSWQALIPQDIGAYIKPALVLITTAYLSSAATKMAQNDFEDASLKSLFKKSMQAMQWMLKIGKHLGTLTQRTFEKNEWKNGNKLVGILNEKGERLFVPSFFLDLYEHIPSHILSKLASLVSDDIRLEVAVREGNKDEIELLDNRYKTVFCPDIEEMLFPELKHGQIVKLKGLVTRGNENANSIGFQYDGHILTCYPKNGSIVKYKAELFLNCEISGRITREDKFKEITELRPKMIFTKLKSLDNGSEKEIETGLFDDFE